jgi:hypothetical protein
VFEGGRASWRADPWRGGRNQWQTDAASELPERDGRASPWANGEGPDAGASSAPGSHAGRGPKGYKRKDERIQEDVSEALAQHPDVDASDIDVTVSDGDVILTGTVATRHEKRQAEDCCEGIRAVRDVQNQLRVRASGAQAPPSADAGSA